MQISLVEFVMLLASITLTVFSTPLGTLCQNLLTSMNNDTTRDRTLSMRMSGVSTTE